MIISPKLWMVFEQLSFIEQVELLQMDYAQTVGRMPTRLVLRAMDVDEFVFWLASDADKACYIAPPMSNEPEIYGMLLRVEPYAEAMRVYFQES